MVTTRLEIGDVDVAIVTDIPINITYVQSDIREPDKRNASFTKTITLFGTNEINILFENLFDTNISTGYFNVNKKTNAVYYANELEVFRGTLQVKKITSNTDFNIVYECVIIGGAGNFFNELGERLITGNTDSALDISFSEYNHIYTRSKAIDSYTNLCDLNAVPTQLSNGAGYVYGFVHRGINQGVDPIFGIVEQAITDNVFRITDFVPQFFLKEYLHKIFNKLGYTLNAPFFDLPENASIIIDPNITQPIISQITLTNSQFNVGIDAIIDVPSLPIYQFGATLPIQIFNAQTTPYNDNGLQIEGTNDKVIIAYNGVYSFRIKGKLKYSVTHSNPAVVKYLPQNIGFGQEVQKYDGILWSSSFSFNTSGVNVSLPSTLHDININYEVGFQSALSSGAQLTALDELRVVSFRTLQFDTNFNPLPSTYTFYDFNNVVVTGGTYTENIYVDTTDYSFSMLRMDRVIEENDMLFVDECLPQNIKQKDFVKSVLQAFNLNFEIDKIDNKLITIDTYDSFYSEFDNWENLVDFDKPIVVNPVALIDFKKLNYSYKQGNDFYNKKYTETYLEVFGTKKIEIDNDFVSSEKKTELIFASTPNVDYPAMGVPMPKSWSINEGKVRPLNDSIRMLYYGGLKPCSQWNFASVNDFSFITFGGTEPTVYTNTYPYVGHVDDAFNPTMDLNFGTPKEVYYTYPNASFTTNNLYNRYHRNFINNITSRDSRTIIAYLWLNSSDIYKFNFRKKVFIQFKDSGAYYIINKIEDFNPLNETSVRVELVKILDAVQFTPESFLIANEPSIISNSEIFNIANPLNESSASLLLRRANNNIRDLII